MVGAVKLPEAIVEFGLWMLDLGCRWLLPSLEKYVAKLKRDLEEICRREGANFKVFERHAIHVIILAEWFGKPVHSLPPELRKKVETVFDRKTVPDFLKKSGFWVLFFLERRYKDALFNEFRKFQREMSRAIQTFAKPDMFDKGFARIAYLFTGKYQPQGYISMPEWRELAWWGKNYRKYKTEPALVQILRDARLDERRIKALISILNWELKDVFDVR